MKRQTVNFPDDLGALIGRIALYAGLEKGKAVSQNTVIVELVKIGVQAGGHTPWWEAIEKAKGDAK